MEIIRYIFIATLCISLFYAVYLLVFRSETNFRQLRFYLLISMLLSLVMPLNTFRIDLNLTADIPADHLTETVKNNFENKTQITNFPDNDTPVNVAVQHHFSFKWQDILMAVYFAMVILFLIRSLIFLLMLVVQNLKSEKVRLDSCIIIYNTRFNHPFSFFKWIFIPANIDRENSDKIITHEKIHASQYHSIDMILVELLSAVMWFNPLIWMMRNNVQLVHEYLADEGALGTGIDKLQYQALLLNQVAEERFIGLSSGFNHSLIKKRMIMMTKSNFNQRTKLRILALIPVAAVLLLGVACVNGQNKPDKTASNSYAVVSPEMMNVLYLGVNNPVAIAVPGIAPSELEVTMTNGNITGKDGQYIVRPKRPGTAYIIISSNGKQIDKKEFRVKYVPDPKAAIELSNGQHKLGGNISKSDLLMSKGIAVYMENFDFDLKFKVTSFVLSATVPNSMTVREEISHSDKFSPRQIDLIKSLIKNQKLMVEQIKVEGPDGSTRPLNDMVFTISGD